MTLRQFIHGKGRGAIPRVAEHLGVNYGTVKKWLTGEYEPGAAMRKRIREMISKRISLAAKGRKNGSRQIQNQKVSDFSC